MPVYVDPMANNGTSATWRWLSNCHMYADSLDELHAMARKLRLKPAWFQDKRVPHYDLTTSKRRAAVGFGAIEHDRRQAGEFWREKGWFPKSLTQDMKDESDGQASVRGGLFDQRGPGAAGPEGQAGEVGGEGDRPRG